MNLENLQVKHKSFGLGTVVSTDGKYMTIRFSIGDKNFVYPDSFEKFLTLADGSVTDEILTDLNKSRAIKQEIIDKKIQENVYSMTHGIVIPGKEITAENEEEEQGYKNSENEEI